MKSLFIINDPPYGMERVCNALRLAQAILKRYGATQVTIFLMAYAVLAAKAQQKTSDGYLNVERMLKRVLVGKEACCFPWGPGWPASLLPVVRRHRPRDVQSR